MFQKFRSLIAGVGLAALLASLFSFMAYAQDLDGPFPDVGSDHENVQSIQFMKDNEVFVGYPDGTYQPDRVLNRAEQLKVYMLLHGIDPDGDVYKNCFPDVGEEWFARFVCYAKSQGWVVGYPDGTFKPAQEVNKVEALKMLGEIQGWDLTVPTTKPFSDTELDQWYIAYVAFAKEAGLLSETGDTFNPGGGLTRGSTAELLFRSLAIYELGGDEYTPDLDDDILLIDVKQIIPPPPVDLAPNAEFGDAPESGDAGYAGSFSVVQANFPTLFNTFNSIYGPGAHALDSSMEYLGDPDLGGFYSYEVDADDLNDPDGVMNLVNEDDFDEGVRGLNIILTSIPPPGYLTMDVTVENGAPDVPRYVNALIDLNMDGEWGGNAAGGEPEWVVRNFVVNVAPGTTETVTSDAFAYSNGLILTPTTWMRVVLSREPIDASAYGNDGWDGSGVFDYGEVEDYYVQLPDWGGGAGGGGGPGAGGRGPVWGKPAPVMVCPKVVNFPKDVLSVHFACGIVNYGAAGNTIFNLWRISGGVNVLPIFGIVPMPAGPPAGRAAGNPTLQWFLAERGSTPSTWGYKIVGQDPESTVSDSIVDLGLVAEDKEEGYTSQDEFGVTDYWAAYVDDAYLFEEGNTGPLITGATFYEMDSTDTPGELHYVVVGHAVDPDTSESALSYSWSSPVGCGMLVGDGNEVEWVFNEDDEYTCLSNGLNLSVSDGSDVYVDSFFDVFFEIEVPENEPPVVEIVSPLWLNGLEDDPHIYELTVYASDPEGGSLTYDWTGVTCGELVGSTDGQIVEWQYPLADMEECGGAQVTVEVTDEENDTTTYTQYVFG